MFNDGYDPLANIKSTEHREKAINNCKDEGKSIIDGATDEVYCAYCNSFLPPESLEIQRGADFTNFCDSDCEDSYKSENPEQLDSFDKPKFRRVLGEEDFE